jgi:uncharacterized membrane protein (DUF373 family)
MSSSQSPRPAPRERVASAFTVVEGIVYVCLGLLLTGIAFTLLATSFISFGRLILSEPEKISFVELLDQILLILLIVGLLYTVQVSVRGRALVPEPFLLVGLISAIRRVLILTAKFGDWHEKTAHESQHIMIELAMNAVLILILAISLMLLRKAGSPSITERG